MKDFKNFITDLTLQYETKIDELKKENARCREALKIIRQEVEEQGCCADWDEIVYQCDQALGERK